MTLPRRIVLLALLASLAVPASASATIGKYWSSGGDYSMTVPPWVTSIHVRAIGEAGGASWFGPDAGGRRVGGAGAEVITDLPVSPGSTLAIRLFQGAGGTCGGTACPDTFSGATWRVGGGGGASDVRGAAATLASRLVVAAGGGGAGSQASGGDAGAAGQSSSPFCTPPGPGTQNAGGAAGAPNAQCQPPAQGWSAATTGSFGAGGTGGLWLKDGCCFPAGYDRAVAGGGGGGGWYGGGGGLPGSGGAGGSSYVAPGATNTTIVPTNANPRVEISYAGSTLSVEPTAAPSTGGKVTSSAGGISCRNDGARTTGSCASDLAPGTQVMLTAEPDALSAFTGWSGGGCSGMALTCTVTMDQARTVGATFAREKPTNTVAVTISGAGGGYVTGPAGLDCGGAGHTTCSVEVLPTDDVDLVAHHDEHSFTGAWTGCSRPNGDTCQLDVTGNRTITVGPRFDLMSYTLSVTPAGAGSGTVTGTGIDCGGGPAHVDCTEILKYGTQVTLTATAATGSAFVDFGGVCTSSPCTLSMTSDRGVPATFTTASHTLYVLPLGNGSATITAPGISCSTAGGDCNEVFPEGKRVELTVTPEPGTEIAGMLGGGCSGSPCTVKLDADTTVLSFVSLIQRKLAVTTEGGGAGTVTSAPAGIDCGLGVPGAACDGTYDHGTQVTLTAAAQPGSRFAGFTGENCPVATATCTLPMTEARTVIATFEPLRTLTIVRSGTGDGTVSGGAITCGTVCAGTVRQGTSVLLTAAPVAGSRFVGFTGGGCAGSLETCLVHVGDDVVVTATFAVRTRFPAPASVPDPSGADPTASTPTPTPTPTPPALTPLSGAAASADLGRGGTPPSGTTGATGTTGTTSVSQRSQAFAIVRTRASRSRGTVAVTVSLPGPGRLKVAARGFKTLKRTVRAGRATVTLKPSRTKGRPGRVRSTRVVVTYTPVGGRAVKRTRTVSVWTRGAAPRKISRRRAGP